MNIILNVVSSLFDLAILFIYLRHFMEERKKNIPVVLYFGAFAYSDQSQPFAGKDESSRYEWYSDRQPG